MNRLPGNLYLTLMMLCLTAGLTGCRNGISQNGWMGGTRGPTTSDQLDGVRQLLQSPGDRSKSKRTCFSPRAKPRLRRCQVLDWQVKPVTNQPVGASANPGYTTSGISYTNSTNYQTTSIDETRDQSRIPLTDATAVKAPVQSVLPPVVSSVSRQNPYGSNPAFPDPIRTAQGQNSLSSTGAPIPYSGHPTFNQPAYSTASSSNTVLAESSVSTDPNSPNYRAGWRDNQPKSDILR